MSRGEEAGASIDALLVAAFRAYRQGLRRQPPPRRVVPRRDFDALTFLGTLGWAPPRDRLLLRTLHAACGAGLAAARQGRLDPARGHLEQAAEHLDRLRQTGARPAMLLGASTYEAAAAYVDFRAGRGECAAARLELAMNADLELEEGDLPVMQMHRIQQGHNLVRMDLRRGRRAGAIRLTGLLAAYLEGRVDALPFHRGWRPRMLRAVPRSLLRLMMQQILGETAMAIAIGPAPATEWTILIDATHPHLDPALAVLPQAQHALGAEAARLRGDLQGYLRDLELLFSSGIRDCHHLWYALLAGLVDVLGELPTSLSRQVRDLLLRDAGHWVAMPPDVRRHFVERRAPAEIAALTVA